MYNFPELQIGISTFESTMSTLQIGVNTYIGTTVNGVLTTVDATSPTDTTDVLNELYNLLRTQSFPQSSLKSTSGFIDYTLSGPWLKCFGLRNQVKKLWKECVGK